MANNDDAILRERTLKKIAPVVVKEKKEEVKREIVKKDSYIIGSEKVLYFMMNGEEYIREYQKKLGFFSDSLYREIANEIVYFLENNKKITVADFITYVNDKDSIKGKVMEIVNDSANDEVTMEAMDEYILALLKVMTKNEIKRLKELMKKELDVDKKMKLAAQIAELKKEEV